MGYGTRQKVADLVSEKRPLRISGERNGRMNPWFKDKLDMPRSRELL